MQLILNSIGMAAIVNEGATCYISASLQLLYSLAPLREQILICNPKTPLGLELKKIFVQMSQLKTVQIGQLATLMNISKSDCRHKQEDAQEFIISVVHKLDKDKEMKRIFSSVFAGSTVTTISERNIEPFLGKCIDSLTQL